MPWWFAVIESRHELQNPTSPDKIRLLGERLALGPGSRVLDVGCGRGGPAVLLAEAFGCSITCVERADEFVAAARERVLGAGLEHLVEVVHMDARDFRAAPDGYDAVLCLGASFIWEGLPGALAALTPATRPGGFVVVGEPYWRRWPLPEGFDPEPDESYVSLVETVERFEAGGLRFVTLIAASREDWDRYESLHWLTLEEWLHEHPHAPEATEFRELGSSERERYLQWMRDLLGWAIFVGRRR
ncbi:MAG: cyclopropane-fatty-acyl-phospholipid synthase family protein [Gaiellaceae bacterium]